MGDSLIMIILLRWSDSGCMRLSGCVERVCADDICDGPRFSIGNCHSGRVFGEAFLEKK
jgi:hypothetical protein